MRYTLVAASLLAGLLAGCVDEVVADSVDASVAPDGSDPVDGTIIELPESILGQPMLFGGALVAVSDADDVYLGDLKLRQLPPVKVRLSLTDNGAAGELLDVTGCVFACGDGAEQVLVLRVPIIGGSDGFLEVNLEDLNAGLPLELLLGPDESTLETTSSRTELVSAADGLLIVETTYDVDVLDDQAPTPRPVTMVGRYYFKPEADLDAVLAPRAPTARVGYFSTWRSIAPRVTRWSLRAPIHYYIKNVPAEYHGAFEVAFGGWDVRAGRR